MNIGIYARASPSLSDVSDSIIPYMNNFSFSNIVIFNDARSRLYNTLKNKLGYYNVSYCNVFERSVFNELELNLLNVLVTHEIGLVVDIHYNGFSSLSSHDTVINICNKYYVDVKELHI